MSYYVRVKDMKWPLYPGDIAIETGCALDPFVCPEGYAEVFSSDMPEINSEIEVAEFSEPELRGGNYYTRWVVRKYTQQELDELARIKKQMDDITTGANNSTEPQKTEAPAVEGEIILEDGDLETHTQHF